MEHIAARRLSPITLDADSADRGSLPPATIRKMYGLLALNMAPLTGMARSEWDTEEAFARWKDDVFYEGLKKGTQHVLLLEDQELRGFLSYATPSDRGEVYLNEFQIDPHSQGDGVTFRILLTQFLREIGQTLYTSIRTYTNNRNTRTQELIERMGFTSEGRTEKGIRYRITRPDAEARFQRWIR